VSVLSTGFTLAGGDKVGNALCPPHRWPHAGSVPAALVTTGRGHSGFTGQAQPQVAPVAPRACPKSLCALSLNQGKTCL
jgi:hypothetical protein